MPGNDRSRSNWSSENSRVATHPTIPTVAQTVRTAAAQTTTTPKTHISAGQVYPLVFGACYRPLERVLARALAPEIRVNAIAPGTITMPGDPPELAADFIKRAPLQRTGTTEDVTAAISFLLNSPFITGEVLVLDGGRTL